MTEEGNHEEWSAVEDDAQDMRLEEELRNIARRFDPVPASVTRAALDSFAWRTVDAELARLVFDSRVDEPALLRGDQDPRMLTFQTPAVTIEVQLTATRDGYDIEGEVDPPVPATVDIRHAGGVHNLRTDDAGRFRAVAVPAGPVSLRCHLTGGDGGEVAVVTEWVPVR
jgi:hypothetical protein